MSLTSAVAGSGQVLLNLLVNEAEEVHVVGCLPRATVLMEQPSEHHLTLVSLLANTELSRKVAPHYTLRPCAVLACAVLAMGGG